MTFGDTAFSNGFTGISSSKVLRQAKFGKLSGGP